MSCKTYDCARFAVVAISIAAVTILLDVAGEAQQTAISHLSAGSSATPATLQTTALSHAPSIRKELTVQLDAGSINFLQAMTYNSGGPCSNSVAIADVNGDGRPDILVANGCPDINYQGQEGSIGLLLGNGDGTFQAAVALDSGGVTPTSVAIADVNADGKPDLIVGNECSTVACPTPGGVIAVLLGNGDGTFQPPVTYAVEGNAMSLAVGDLNKDGKPDLVVTSCPLGCPGLISVLLGNGDGTFGVPVTYLAGGFVGGESLSAAVSDVNGDGNLDVIVAGPCSDFTCATGAVRILLGNGDGTLQPAVTYQSGGYVAISVAIADVNSDGKQDLVVANSESSSSVFQGSVAVLLGNGDGTFKSATAYPSGADAASAIATADVNNDGISDVIVAHCTRGTQTSFTCPNANDGGTVAVIAGNGDGTFQAPILYRSGGIGATSVAVADVNGDELPDIVVAHHYLKGGSGPGGVGVLVNNSGPKSPTSTSLASSLNPSVYGRTIDVTVTVTSDSGTPTGSVQILNGTTIVGSGTLANGAVSIPVSTLPAGTDSITASYLGGGGFAPSKSAPLTQTVTKAMTTTSLASSLNPVGTNQAVTFTAAISSQYGGAASGTVTFLAGAHNLGSAALSGNVASLTTSLATVGTYSITAQYSGDSNNAGSTSGALSEKVVASTVTTLNSSLNPSVIGQTVTFTATVGSSSGNPPNGEIVTLYNGSAVLGTAPLSAGTATLTTSALPAGILTITARYPGDSNFAASTSAGLRQTVNATTKSATATTLSSSLNPSIYGQKVTFVAQVTTSGPLPPTGTVAFVWKYFTQTYTIGTAPLNSAGVATLTKSNLNAGAYPMTAVYRGDTNNLGSTSAVLNQTVLQTSSAATITSSLNPSRVGQSVTFTAKITSPTVIPSGPVTFRAGTTVLGTAQLSGGKAVFTTSTLLAGPTVIKVSYNGNSNIKGSSASVMQTVQP